MRLLCLTEARIWHQPTQVVPSLQRVLGHPLQIWGVLSAGNPVMLVLPVAVARVVQLTRVSAQQAAMHAALHLSRHISCGFLATFPAVHAQVV